MFLTPEILGMSLNAHTIIMAVWLVLLVTFLLIEIGTQGLTTIWFAPGALMGLLLEICHVHIVIQIVLFVILSVIFIVFTRPVAIKYLNEKSIKTNVETLVGSEAIVKVAINNLKGEGEVFINGLDWTARAVSNDITIEKDTLVVVKEVEGVKLIVEKKN